MRFNPLRAIKYFTLRFMRLRGSPYSLAMGAAVGVFIGISPTVPLHTVAIIGITLLMRVSTISALIAGAVVCNPLTMAPQYYLCWKAGNMILPDRLTWNRIQEVLIILKDSGFMESLRSISHLSKDAIAVMLTGGFVIGLPLAVLCYFLSFRFFVRLREKKRQKHLLN